MKSKFEIGDKVKGVRTHTDLVGIVNGISHSGDSMWVGCYGSTYCREHYKISIELSLTHNTISWFHEDCFVLSD